ncbi:EpsG family protein [Pectobacterium polaris]|uniref:EpsG family protein n=2 Tax=Pectobacterium polaris TaxID=2042057 RepID=UPI000D61C195|nr:EpsG family protein [Pectobacterium polaris]MCU1788938.1 EpsG family protein [Pectobacterium polaris]PWD59405.1 EpsG family protein [Pectobacterium polaris]
MMYFPYFFILFFSTLIKQNKITHCITLIITILYFCLSYPAGGDWIGYYVNYRCIVDNYCLSENVSFEPGFNFIVYTLGQLGFLALNIGIIIFNVYCIYVFSRNFKNRNFIIFSLMCFFAWVIYTEAIRQSIAISIILLGIPALVKKERLKFLLVVSIAAFFHITALISVLFLLPSVSKSLSRLTAYVLIILSAVFFFFNIELLRYIISILPIQGFVFEKLDFYINSDTYKPQFSAGIGTAFDFLLVYIVIKTISFIKKRNLELECNTLSYIIPGVIIFITFSLLIGKMMPVLARIGWYGIPFIIIILNVNISDSIFFSRKNFSNRIPLRKLLVYVFLLSQIIRPLTYEHSRYGIMNQVTIFHELNSLDDDGLYINARKKCDVLYSLGYRDLCYL